MDVLFCLVGCIFGNCVSKNKFQDGFLILLHPIEKPEKRPVAVVKPKSSSSVQNPREPWSVDLFLPKKSGKRPLTGMFFETLLHVFASALNMASTSINF